MPTVIKIQIALVVAQVLCFGGYAYLGSAAPFYLFLGATVPWALLFSPVVMYSLDKSS